MSSKPYIALAARSLCDEPGQPNGFLFSPRDTVAALLGSRYPLTVMTTRRFRVSDWAPGAVSAEPAWLEVGGWLARRRIAALQPAALFVEDPQSHRMIETLRNWTGLPKAMIVRGSPDQFKGTYTDLPSELERVVKEMAGYSVIVNVSSRVAEKWKTFPELKNCEFRYIPNCGREEEGARILGMDRSALRAELGFGPDAFVVVCVASVQRRKGQDLLVAAWSDIKRQVPSAELVLVGPVCESWGGRELLEAIRAHPFAGSIRVLGPRTDALELTYAADLFVLPSREEAMPRAVLETMILKTPIVASDVDGIPELVETEKEALLFSPARPAQLAEHIVRLAKDRPRAARLADHARRKYDSTFARRLQIERYRQLVDDMIGGGR